MLTILFKKSSLIKSKIFFKISDYDFDWYERSTKFIGYDVILCEKCNRKFDSHYLFYCKHCYDEENNEEERNRMLYGKCKKCSRACTEDHLCSSCGFQNNENNDDIKKLVVFKSADYDLNMYERVVKYKDYNLIFCGKCKQKHENYGFYCEHCYDKEGNEEEKNRMLYGKCKNCFQACTDLNWCSTCGIQNFDDSKKQIVFDYDLDRDERKVKYKDYDIIFCEKCKQEFLFNRSDSIYCEHCFDKEKNEEEKNRMLYGKCKKCSRACTELNWCSNCGFQNFDDFKKQIVFKVSDYDLSMNEREVKYKNYDLIFCGKCKQKFDKQKFGSYLFYCKCCYFKKINEEEKNHMLYGKCENCFKVCTKNDQCSYCGIQRGNVTYFKMSDYNLDLKEREVKFKNYDFTICKKCKQTFYYNSYCKQCYNNKKTNEVERNNMQYKGCKECFKELYGCLSCRFQQVFNKWTSGNKNIDTLVQESQISARDLFGILEWIPYNRFTDVEIIAEGGFAKVYSATWIDGYIVDWKESNNWKRCGSLKVALKVLNNSSENISKDFLNEVKSLNIFPSSVYSGVMTFYGITREPSTRNYALVFKLEDSGLRYYLIQNYDLLTWERRLCIIQRICSGLRSIHSYGLIHKDLHIGNILHSILNDQSFTYIGDFGFCMPANEISSNSKIYGVMPYMAPEILRCKPYTKASDIYSLGIIINEIISIIPPFNNEPHDHHLALDICRGRRPKIREETPKYLKELIEKCWDANPENRPSSGEIETLISDFVRRERSNMYTKEFKELYNSIIITSTHPEAIYTSRLLNLPNLPEPINCQPQDELVFSRNIAERSSN